MWINKMLRVEIKIAEVFICKEKHDVWIKELSYNEILIILCLWLNKVQLASAMDLLKCSSKTVVSFHKKLLKFHWNFYSWKWK